MAVEKQLDVYKIFTEGKKFARVVIAGNRISVLPITSSEAENAKNVTDLQAVVQDDILPEVMSQLLDVLNRPDEKTIPRAKGANRDKGKKPTIIEITLTLSHK
ncbi:hypothetical protein ACFL0C_02010 [Patescibacteria group bacterium]